MGTCPKRLLPWPMQGFLSARHTGSFPSDRGAQSWENDNSRRRLIKRATLRGGLGCWEEGRRLQVLARMGKKGEEPAKSEGMDTGRREADSVAWEVSSRWTSSGLTDGPW